MLEAELRARNDRSTESRANSAGRDRPRYQVVRALWLSREPLGELRATGLCQLLSEGAPSGGVLRGAAQQLADGLLPPGDAHHRRASGAASRCGRSTSRARTGCARSRRARCGSACATWPACKRGGRRGLVRARAERPFASVADVAQRARRQPGGDDDAGVDRRAQRASPTGRSRARRALWQTAALGRSGNALFGGIADARRRRCRSTRCR